MTKQRTYGLPKQRRIKRQKIFEALVREGRSAFVYPFKAVYLPGELPEPVPWQVGFAVSKRRFRKAVHRNRIKRLMREAFRLNQHILEGIPPTAILLIYVSKEELAPAELMKNMKKLLEKIQKQLQNDGTT